MTLPLIDTHCHLDVKEFSEDRDDMFSRADEARICGMMTLGTDLPSSVRSLDLARSRPGVYAAVGLHPNDAKGEGPVDWLPYQELASDPRVIAWGEIGLDNHWDFTTPDRQQQVLRDQLAIARDLHLPISVHIREAQEETLRILAEPTFKEVTGILHCWSGDLEGAQRAIDMGYLIGIGGPVTFKNSSLPDIARVLPWNSMVVETDAPYLAPMPRRGKRNEPSLVRYTFEKLVEVKADLDPADAARTLWTNFERVFPRFDLSFDAT